MANAVTTAAQARGIVRPDDELAMPIPAAWALAEEAIRKAWPSGVLYTAETATLPDNMNWDTLSPSDRALVTLYLSGADIAAYAGV
jgi:hypothetical protein